MDGDIKHDQSHQEGRGPVISGIKARQGSRHIFTMRVMITSIILAVVLGAILWLAINAYTARDEQPLAEDVPVESTPPAVPQNNGN